MSGKSKFRRVVEEFGDDVMRWGRKFLKIGEKEAPTIAEVADDVAKNAPKIASDLVDEAATAAARAKKAAAEAEELTAQAKKAEAEKLLLEKRLEKLEMEKKLNAAKSEAKAAKGAARKSEDQLFDEWAAKQERLTGKKPKMGELDDKQTELFQRHVENYYESFQAGRQGAKALAEAEANRKAAEFWKPVMYFVKHPITATLEGGKDLTVFGVKKLAKYWPVVAFNPVTAAGIGTAERYVDGDGDIQNGRADWTWGFLSLPERLWNTIPFVTDKPLWSAPKTNMIRTKLNAYIDPGIEWIAKNERFQSAIKSLKLNEEGVVFLNPDDGLVYYTVLDKESRKPLRKPESTGMSLAQFKAFYDGSEEVSFEEQKSERDAKLKAKQKKEEELKAGVEKDKMPRQIILGVPEEWKAPKVQEEKKDDRGGNRGKKEEVEIIGQINLPSLDERIMFSRAETGGADLGHHFVGVSPDRVSKSSNKQV